MADNALFGGFVTDPSTDNANSRSIREFNDLVAGDARVECSLINVGDGLLLIRKLLAGSRSGSDLVGEGAASCGTMWA